MSQPLTSSGGAPGTGASSGGGSGPSPEKSARRAESPPSSSSAAQPPPPAWAAKKPRSCAVCRSRKVRCDKQTPCSNCRRANIACVVPSSRDKPPRWAHRLERMTGKGDGDTVAVGTEVVTGTRKETAAQVMDRLRNLEGLVKELSGQLERANAAAAARDSAAGGSSGVGSPVSGGADYYHQTAGASSAVSTGMATKTTDVQKHFGRLVLQDSSQSRYVGSGFWSRVNDEIDELEMNTRGLAGDRCTDTSEEDVGNEVYSQGRTPSTQELERTPSERHAFLFRHSPGASPSSPPPSLPELSEFRPLPSQIPFLMNTFSENVNCFLGVVHMPSMVKMIRERRGTDMSGLSPANEALMFSIYYAAVTSMETDDVVTNFGSSKAELNLRYRLGLEYALARADFLNTPDLVLVQAMTIFLFLVRRHDSPRYVWMMTGLVIRMAQAIGLHRDGSHFPHLSPFEAEMRRRVWWVLLMLDVRTSEDQGMSFTVTAGSFDTRMPLNLNDADIDPSLTKVVPAVGREAITDISFALVTFEFCDITRQMMAPGGLGDGGPTLEEQIRLLGSLYVRLEQAYLRYSVDPGTDIAYWVGVTATRLVMSKMTLFIYLPALFSSPSERFSDEVRRKLLVAALEVAEYNHALNAESACRQWRWMFQTYTHWNAIVYLLLEASRRPWSPLVERAWVAVHSGWLIPPQPRPSEQNKNNYLRIWVPLRKLMGKLRRHRDAELRRLREGGNPAVKRAEMEDRSFPIPASPGPEPFLPAERSEELFREHWRALVVTGPVESENQGRAASSPVVSTAQHPSIVVQAIGTPPHAASLTAGSEYGVRDTWSESVHSGGHGTPPITGTSTNLGSSPQSSRPRGSALTTSGTIESSSSSPIYNDNRNTKSQPEVPDALPRGSQSFFGPDFVTPWLWADDAVVAEATATDPAPGAFAGVDVAMDIEMDVDLGGTMDWNNWLESAAGVGWL